MKFDFVTRDSHRNEIAVYLVESGPWIGSDQNERLQSLQVRLNGAMDIVLSGRLAERFPESRGARVRIQVDLHDAPPQALVDLVQAFGEMIASDDSTREEIAAAREFVSELRVVCRAR